MGRGAPPESDGEAAPDPNAEIEFPPLPERSTSSNWIEVSVRGYQYNSYAIDPASITIGKDKIVRYSLLVRSAGGVDNVTFEGARCGTSEWKLYAVGRPDGSWAMTPSPAWRGIRDKADKDVHRGLITDYVCDRDQVVPRNVEFVVRRVKSGQKGLLDNELRR